MFFLKLKTTFKGREAHISFRLGTQFGKKVNMNTGPQESRNFVHSPNICICKHSAPFGSI